MADDDLNFEFEAHLEKKQPMLPATGGPGMEQHHGVMVMVPPQELIGQQPGNYRKNYKKTVCTYWLRGMCMKGDACGFLHQYDVEKMPICRNLLKYGECKDIDCPYKHDTEEIKECNMYKLGFCIFGPQCRFKHKPAAGPPPAVETIEAAKPKEVRNINAVVNSVNPGVIEEREKLRRLEGRAGWSEPFDSKRPRALMWGGDIKPDTPGPRPPSLPPPPSQQPQQPAPWHGSMPPDRPPVPGPRPPDHPPPHHLVPPPQPPPGAPPAGPPGPQPPSGAPPASHQNPSQQQPQRRESSQQGDQQGSDQQQGIAQGMPNIHPPAGSQGQQLQGSSMPSLIPGGPGPGQGMGQHGMGPGFQFGGMGMGPGGFMPMMNQGMMGVQGMPPMGMPPGMQGMMMPQQGNMMGGMNMMGNGMMMGMHPPGAF